MTLVHILVFIPLAFLAGKIRSSRHRVLFLLATSLAAVYWLQPALPVRNMDFWLPTLSIALVVLTWASTHPAGSKENGQKPQPAAGDAANRGGGRPPLLSRLVSRPNLLAILLIASVLLAIALTRYTGSLCCLTATRPPAVWQVLLVAGVVILLGTLFVRLVKNRQILTTAIITLILAFFIVLKSPFLIERASAWLRTLTGQPVELATATDLAWLGFSFLAFRLIHVLRDFQTGKLPRYSLADVTSYALFFPAYTAGPIDRSQRWISESQKQAAPSSADLIDGAWRIFSGLFKKFVLADSLALIALSSQNATQMQSALWAWIILYAYALRIYLDFSGYTDIAIGLGRLAGFRLPENFAAPYLKTNLTAFWNSWHITLAQWFRAYFFNPLTRSLRSPASKRFNMPAWGIILLGQLTTMLLIGLWHGITLNFAIWGLWHGIGLFLHNRWSEWMRPRSERINSNPSFARLANAGGWLLTFNFVTLGWVWFALPTPELALSFFERLVGV
jgi:alginate O-acetyltransferase complex protein AlgI